MLGATYETWVKNYCSNFSFGNTTNRIKSEMIQQSIKKQRKSAKSVLSAFALTQRPQGKSQMRNYY